MNQLPTFKETSFTAIARNGEPWVTSTDLARALGYSRSDHISRIFERNAGEFTPEMTTVLRLDPANPAGAHRQIDVVPPSKGHSDTRIFSLRGAHLVAMFAKTPVAAEFRRWVLDVLDRQTALERGSRARTAHDLATHLGNYDLCSTHAAAVFLFGNHPDSGAMAAAAAMLRAIGWRKTWSRGPEALKRTRPALTAPTSQQEGQDNG